jgi:hypothetical protein
VLNGDLVKRNIMLGTENFYFGILPQALRYPGIIILAPAMHGIETPNPFGTAQTIALADFRKGASWTSLAPHVFYNDLMEFPVNRTDNRVGCGNCELFRKGRIPVPGSMFFSEGIQNGLLGKFMSVFSHYRITPSR